MDKIRVAIFGAAGYAGEELLRILTRHRQCEIVAITSRKNAGQPISSVFPRFTNSGLTFVMPDAASLKGKCDAAILALPHGLATEFAIPLLEQGIKVFDISADFRLRSPEKYKEYYGTEHPAKELLAKAVYGLPERYRAEIAKADLVACPGCYPTSSILPTAPLLAAGLVSTKNVAVVSSSGVTGAGRKVDLAYIFPECNESVKAYKVFGHRHLPEIEQEMAAAAKVDDMNVVYMVGSNVGKMHLFAGNNVKFNGNIFICFNRFKRRIITMMVGNCEEIVAVLSVVCADNSRSLSAV
ncbi:MAG: N-acetyl-gamma-glutamyl-phosphate reductase [Lentisphaeria bacterium]|nr:N-acetyl-gamma-glutamyl-phosphate reductase [Lentisphaeria bacterium]